MTTLHTSTLKRVRAYSNEILKIMFRNEQIWPIEIEYPIDYFCFSSESPLTFKIIGPWTKEGTEPIDIIYVYYSYDLENWSYISFNKNRENYTRESNYINFGGSYGNVYLRGKNIKGFDIFNNPSYIKRSVFAFYFGNSSSVVVSGNIRSLVDWECMNSDPTVNSIYTYGGGFSQLFSKCTQITDASNLKIYTDGPFIFREMFYKCTNMTKGPQIISTTITAQDCFVSTFSGCSALTQAPELPATTLANSCYAEMFADCTSLTQAPELPATTLAGSCYDAMFIRCTSLINAPELPATTLAPRCYSVMFKGCTSLLLSPYLPSTTLAASCYSGMFENTNILPDCTNIDFSSENVVASGGLKGLFSATKITYADLTRILPKDFNDNPCLPVLTLTNDCYSSMFSGCTSLTQAPVLPSTTLAERCYLGMFSGCTSLTQAPELPATTLAALCYLYMFQSCSKLNYIKMMATDISASNCLNNWVKGVSSTGTFVKNSAATWDVKGASGIPTGWTILRVSE